MTLSARQLIAFTPGPHAAGGTTSLGSLSISLAVKLNGLVVTTTTGQRLHAELTIPFAPSGSLCDRATFTGITPVGHAPMGVELAAYNGSTCWYTGLSDAPLTIYSDADDDGWSLNLHLPNRNAYSFFTWPAPVVTYDPPLGEGVAAPDLRLELVRFSNAESHWVSDGGESGTGAAELYEGVRLPMRLYVDPGLSRPLIPIRELIDEDCPIITGSGTDLRCDQSPVFKAVTAREIRAALAAQSIEAGTYNLIWKIYKGDGDMVYRARCIADGVSSELHTELEGREYVDRRTGTSGLIETTDLVAGAIDYGPTPLAFNINTSRVDLEYGCDGEQRDTDREAGSRYWIGGDPAESCSWSATEIYLAGRAVRLFANDQYTLEYTLCACLVTDVAGNRCLQFLAKDGDSALLFRRPLKGDRHAVLHATIELPPFEDVVRPGNFSFSSSGLRVCAYENFIERGSMIDDYPGRVWEAELTESTPDGAAVEIEVSAFSEIASVQFEFYDLAGTYTPAPESVGSGDEAQYTTIKKGTEVIATSGKGRLLLSAFYRGDELIHRVLEVEQSRSMSTEYDYESVYLQCVTRWFDYVTGASGFELINANQFTGYYRSRVFSATNIDVDRDYNESVLHVHDIGVSTQTHSITLSDYAAIETRTFVYARPQIVAEDYYSDYDVPAQYASVLVSTDAAWTEDTTSSSTGTNRYVVVAGHSLCDNDPLTYAVARTDTSEPTETEKTARLFRAAPGGSDAEILTLDYDSILFPDGPWRSFPVDGVESFAGEIDLRAKICERLQYASRVALNLLRSARGVDCACHILTNNRPNRWAAVTLDPEHAALSTFTSTLDADQTVYQVAPVEPRACILAPDTWPDIPDFSGAGPDVMESLLAAHNTKRSNWGRSPLTWSAQLAQAAGVQARYCDEVGVIDHVGAGGSTVYDRVVVTGYFGEGGGGAAENLAWGHTTVDSVMDGWMNSEHHRENILGEWTEMGGAQIASSAFGTLWCVVFGVKNP